MRPLFRAFSAGRVRYLVIGGQATILYGAAHFSQDLDIWVDPAESNIRRFVGALERLRARFHKLTPPLTRRNLMRGHGFHFVVPLRGGDVYLDAMGRPPRVGPFSSAWKRSVRFQTPWGDLPVVSIPDLVELKKTNRHADYEIITRLALIRLSAAVAPSPALLRWTLDHVFRVEDLVELLARTWSAGRVILPPGMHWLGRWWSAVRGTDDPAAAGFDVAARQLGAKAQGLQSRGRRYWAPLLRELRRFRSTGQLLPEGTRVTRSAALGLP